MRVYVYDTCLCVMCTTDNLGRVGSVSSSLGTILDIPVDTQQLNKGSVIVIKLSYR